MNYIDALSLPSGANIYPSAIDNLVRRLYETNEYQTIISTTISTRS